MTPLDQRALRSAFGSFMTGVTVVTTRRTDGTPVGFTANSFASVSLDPPLLLVCPGDHLSSFRDFKSCRHFAVSVLAEGQENVSNAFASSIGDRFAVAPHHDDANGVPVIDGAVCTFSCRIHSVVPAGDHIVLMGEVTAFSQTEGPGLGYSNGAYFSLGLERAALSSRAQSTIGGAIIACDNTVLLEPTAYGYQPPHITCREHTAIRSDLKNALGLTHLGPVYSVFDDPGTGTHFTFIRATVAHAGAHPALEAVPITTLPTLAYTSPAIKDMMIRYAQEAQNGDFGLYLGDAQRGGVHTTSDDRT